MARPCKYITFSVLILYSVILLNSLHTSRNYFLCCVVSTGTIMSSAIQTVLLLSSLSVTLQFPLLVSLCWVRMASGTSRADPSGETRTLPGHFNKSHACRFAVDTIYQDEEVPRPPLFSESYCGERGLNFPNAFPASISCIVLFFHFHPIQCIFISLRFPFGSLIIKGLLFSCLIFWDFLLSTHWFLALFFCGQRIRSGWFQFLKSGGGLF